MREVRVIDEDGGQRGIMPTEQALALARDRDLDLVEVAPTAQPPVVRIMDYGKFKYEQAKRESEGRRKQKAAELREVKMKPHIGKHDHDFKTRTAAKLLRAGDKVKITVMFRGREITHPQIGRERITTMMEALEAGGIPLAVEKTIGMEGRFMSVIVTEDRARAAAIARERARAAAAGEATAPSLDDEAPLTEEEIAAAASLGDDDDDQASGTPPV